MPSKLDPYKAIIEARLAEYPKLTATRLVKEVREAGYPGSYSQVKRYVPRVRPLPPEERLQQPDVYFEPLARRGGRPDIEQTEATSLGKNPVLGAVSLAVREKEAFRRAAPGVYTREVTGCPFGVNQRNRLAFVPSEIATLGELLKSVAELADDVLPGIGRFNGSDFLSGRCPSGWVALQPVFKGVAGQEAIDGQAIATDTVQVVSDAADGIEGRELPYFLQRVQQEFRADRLDRSVPMGGTQDPDAAGVFRVVGDDEVGNGGAAHALLPLGAHEDVAGSLGLGYLNGADGDRSRRAGPRREGAGGGLFGEVIEECGCGQLGAPRTVAESRSRSS